MSHAVHYRDAAGDIHLEDRPSLAAALELVEHLQNDNGATEVRVFREVPIEVKTYYRVVAVADGGDANGAPVAQVIEPQPEPEAVSVSVAEPQAESVAEPPAEPIVAPAAVVEPPEVPAAERAPVEPVVAAAPRLAPVEPPSGATIMSPPPVSIAPAEDTGDGNDAEPRGDHRRQLFGRG